MDICVVGLGYIGLPTAGTFATYGSKVVGVDANPAVVEELRRGEVRIQEPGLHAFISAALESGNLRVSVEVQPADTFIIAVPTPLAGDGHGADLSFVLAAAESIAPHLRRGALVILESTSPPGTTLGAVASALNRSGLIAGSDFSLAFCAERVIPGRILTELVENDRVIGGVDPSSAERAAELYGSFVRGQIYLTDAKSAEMVKLVENTFRDVNIAFANELARVCDKLEIDVHEVIALANRHPRVNVLQPGPGVGGHCIAVDPWFIVDAAPDEASLIRAARDVNDRQPQFVLSLVERALEGVEDARVAVLGLTYKADVDDVRESPAIDVVRMLLERGFEVRLHDPLAASFPFGERVGRDLESALRGADVMLILTDHAVYRELAPQDAGVARMRHRTIVDTRHCLSPAEWRAERFQFLSLGDGRLSEHRFPASRAEPAGVRAGEVAS
jgi:UDP-N-acetyl-D-mannosaminuronic acid dehydrogenase